MQDSSKKKNPSECRPDQSMTFARLLEEIPEEGLSEADIKVMACNLADNESYKYNLSLAHRLREQQKIILLIGILPPYTAGKRVVLNALRRIDNLRPIMDGCFLINQDSLIGDGSFPGEDALCRIEIIIRDLEDSLDNILKKGQINICEATLLNVLKDCGTFMVTRGAGSGHDRVRTAFSDAYKSPSFSRLDITTARKLIIKVTLPKEKSLTTDEVKNLEKLVSSMSASTDVILGVDFWNPELEPDRLRITMLATGIDTFRLTNLILNPDSKDISSTLKQ